MAERILKTEKLRCMSAFGTKRTSQPCCFMSAFGGEADMAIELKFSTFDKMQATRTTPINRGKMLSLGDRFIPHIVPRDGFCCQESWSEWQDLNLRPPRPERGTRPPYSVRQQRLSPVLEPPRQASHELPYTDFWEARMISELAKPLRLLYVC